MIATDDVVGVIDLVWTRAIGAIDTEGVRGDQLAARLARVRDQFDVDCQHRVLDILAIGQDAKWASRLRVHARQLVQGTCHAE